jgi:hypothetical protein
MPVSWRVVLGVSAGGSVLSKILHWGFGQYVSIAGVLARRAAGAGVARVQRRVSR